MKNKIKIVSVLVALGFLITPTMGLAASVVLPMTVHGTITSDGANMAAGTILKAYCGNTTTEIGTVTLTVAGEYDSENTSLPVNNCASANIYVQATYGGTITEKKDTGFAFTAAEIREYNIAFTTSSSQPATPTAPSSLAAVVDSQTEITLSWVDNSNNETRFEVHKDGVKLYDTAANAVTYQATGLTAETTYTFKVRAANGDEYSGFTSDVSAITLKDPETANPTTGLIAGTALDADQTGYVNNSITETITKGASASIISDITIVGNIGGTLSSITSSSDDIVVAKQAIVLGTASNPGTGSSDFNTNSGSTAGVVETTVLVPTDTTSTAGQRVAVVIPELTLIKTSGGANLASVEIRPPVINSATTVENSITFSFSESDTPADVKASVSIPTSVSGITFYAANGTTVQYIDICMDKSNFTVTNASDIQVYYSADNVSWAIDSAARNKQFIGNQFCYQTNHLSSFAGAQANTKSTACTQSGAPSNASYTAGNVTVTWSGSAWSTAANCSWSCDSGYTLSGSTCVSSGGTVSPGGGGTTPSVEMPSTTTGDVTATKKGGGMTSITTTDGGKASVKVPAYAVSANTKVSIESKAATSEGLGTVFAVMTSDYTIVGNNVYEITASADGSAITEFSKKLTISLTYTDAQISGLTETSLTISYWDTDEEKWFALPTTVDKATNTLTARTDHLTYFAILSGLGESVVVDDDVDKPVSEMTQAEIRAAIAEIIVKIKQLQAILAQMRGETIGVSGCSITSFDRSLKRGMSGNDVKCLQLILNSVAETKIASSGVGSPGQETNYFGGLTKAGVIKFQEKYTADVLSPHGLTSGTGYVGRTTRAKLNTLLK